MRKLLSILLFSASYIIASNALAHETKTPIQELTQSQEIWIDVRSEQEYNEGHLQGAINIPVNKIVEEITKVTTDKSAPINLYCRSGRRSGLAMEELNKLGYKNVTNHGGYQELLNKGMK